MGFFNRRKADRARAAEPAGGAATAPTAETPADLVDQAEHGSATVATPAPGSPADCAWRYASACEDVVVAGHACLQAANKSIGFRNKASERPQHEISIEAFSGYADMSKRELAESFAKFDESCSRARKAASRLLSVESENGPEIALLTSGIGEQTLDKVAKAKPILRSRYGPTPEAFLEGVQETNRLIANDDPKEGNIYTPRLPAESGERSCPWCAETIESEAVICTFCGKDASSQPNTL